MSRYIAMRIALFAGLIGQVYAESSEPAGPGEPIVNRVLNLDGKTGYMQVADSQSFHSFREAITVEAWVKAASFYPDDGQVNCIVRKNIAPGAENFLLRFRIVDGEPVVEMNPGLRIGIAQAFHEFTTGTWYHLAGTYDGKAVTVYVNGAKVKSERFSGSMNIDKSDLFIGKGDPEFSLGEYFHGALDDIRLWNIARSQKEIQTTMNTPLTGKEKGLVAYWNFDDGTAKDLSLNGNDGQLYEDAKIIESPRAAVPVPGEQTAEAEKKAGALKGRDKRMGYCFDVALDEKRSKLYVAGGDGGLHVFSVRDGELQFITSLRDEGYHRNLKIAGDRLFLADAERGLVVYDISGDVPVKTWTQGKQGKGSGMGIHVEGRHAYLAWGKGGLAIFDIANPDSPKMTGQCTSLDDAWDVWVKGEYAYVADLHKGVATIDVSDLAQPKKTSVVTWDEEESMAEIIRGESNSLFVGAGKHGLVSLDLSDPAHPRLASIFHPSEGSFGEGLCVRDGLVYLANGHGGLRHENGLIVVDARKLDSLKELGRCCFLGWVEGVCVSRAHAFVANTQSGVRSVNVSDPAKPVLKDSFGPIRDPYYDSHLDTPVRGEEKRELEELVARRQEILAGKEFRDQSTPVRAFLTMIWAIRSGDLDLYIEVFPSRGARVSPQQFKKDQEQDIKDFEKAEIVRLSSSDLRGDEGSVCAVYVRWNPEDLPLAWDAYVFQRQNDGKWKLLYNTGCNDGLAWRKWVSESSLLKDKDPLLDTGMSSKEVQAIEEFRQIKARILAGESHSDTSTPLHAFLTHLSNLKPGQARDYFMGVDIFRAPLPPDTVEEGTIWPLFAGRKALGDTFVLGYSKGRWIWIGNHGNNGDWRAGRSWFKEQLRQKIEAQ